MKQYSSGHVVLIGALVAVIAGCDKSKSNGSALSQDSTLTKDLQLAGADSSAQPKLADTSAPVTAPTPSAEASPATVPALAAPAKPAKTASASHRKSHRAPTPTTTAAASTTNSPPAPAPAKTSDTSVSPSGNTVVHNENPTGAGGAGLITAGTTIVLASNTQICTNTNHPGDQFTATVSDAVLGSNGAVIPAGATASGHVVAVAPSNNANQAITLQLAIDAISVNGASYPVTATVVSSQVDKQRATSTGQDATKVGVGAVAGGLLGGLIGHGAKGAIIGAAAGAAGGGAVAVGTAKYQGCVPQGGKITIKLNSDTPIRT